MHTTNILQIQHLRWFDGCFPAAVSACEFLYIIYIVYFSEGMSLYAVPAQKIKVQKYRKEQ